SQCANVTNASDSGTATLIVTANNLPISTGPMQIINGTTVAATVMVNDTAAGALTALPINQNWTTGNIFIIQGLGHGAALNGDIFAVASSSLSNVKVTATGFVQAAVA